MEAGNGGYDARDEDGASSAELFVHRVSEPAAENGTAKVGSRVDETQKPGVSLAICTDAELVFVKELGTVNDRLVHSLDSSA